MTTLRAALTKQLGQKVQRHGLVIWEDREGEYKDVASSVAPEDVRFEPFNGSWYDLRRSIESAVSGDRPPRLVVYTPAPIKDDDPLAEVRDAAGKFTRRLSTLVRQSLRGTLSPARITAISEQARTLREAEMAAEGPGETDVRLTRVMGARTPLELLVSVLIGASDDDLSKAGLWDAVAAMANQTVGADVAGVSDELRHDLFQHLLLADISRVIEGPLPDILQAGVRLPLGVPTPEYSGPAGAVTRSNRRSSRLSASRDGCRQPPRARRQPRLATRPRGCRRRASLREGSPQAIDPFHTGNRLSQGSQDRRAAPRGEPLGVGPELRMGGPMAHCPSHLPPVRRTRQGHPAGRRGTRRGCWRGTSNEAG